MAMTLEDEARARRVYRRVLIVAIVVVVAVSIWAIRLPKHADLRFLRAYHPTRISSPPDQVCYTFAQPPTAIITALDANLNKSGHWTKANSAVGFADYFESYTPDDMYISVTPLGKTGTSLIIRGVDKRAKLP
ncbi:MAG TPA: hypothetical protein VHE55_02355 [Fimbriimonadaceae bacterium]|nr:hypothetical protein [Fimbriimonadaceae bacterium]